MKQTFVLLFLVFGIATNFGQNCDDKLALNSRDIITNKKELKSAYMSLKANFKSNYTISFELDNNKLKMVSSSTDEKVNEKGNQIIFTFENGEKFNLEFSEKSATENINNQTIYFNKQEIDLTQLKLFATKNIELINLNGIDKKIEFKSKKAKVIVEYTNCFYQNIEEDDLTIEEVIEINEDECQITEDKVDEFEGTRIKKLKRVSLAWASDVGIPFTIMLFRENDEYFLKAELDAVSYCVTNKSELNFKLENDEIIRFNHISKTDCGKSASFYVQLTQSDISKLKVSPVKLIRMETEDGKYDLSIIKKPSYFFKNLDCLVE